jgi:hypothetical protein
MSHVLPEQKDQARTHVSKRGGGQRKTFAKEERKLDLSEVQALEQLCV